VQVPLEEAAASRDPGGDPGDAFVRRSELAQALAALAADDRAAVLLVDAQGFDYREAASVLEVPEGTIASRLNRARTALRAALGEGAAV
jgi:RNA polymerase sigma-70 factor (ECF subfamily)